MRFKCESEGENIGRRKIRIHFLARNISEVKGACLNSKMGTRTSDKRVDYSHELAQTKQQVG